MDIDTGFIFEGRLFGEDTRQRDNQKLKRLVKALFFKIRKFGEGGYGVDVLRGIVTTEQIRLIKLVLERIFSDNPPPGIEERLLEYGYAP